MKKIVSILMTVALLFSLSVTVFSARKITDEEKAMLADMKGKEVLGRKISASDIAALENFLMGADRPLTQKDIDTILENIDQVINIILTSGATDLKNLPADVMNKIMKILDSTVSIADLAVSISPAANGGSTSVTITDKAGAPVIITKEKIIKATGSPYEPEQNRYLPIILMFITALFGLAFTARRKNIKSAVV